MIQRKIKRDKSGNVIQQIGPIDRGYKRYDSSTNSFSLKYSGFSSDFRPDGFLIKILESGSEGYTEIDAKRDLSNDLSFGPDFKMIAE